MTSHLTGALVAIIADPGCCAASKAIARDALAGKAQRISDAEAALAKIERTYWLEGKDAARRAAEMRSIAVAELEKAHNPLVLDFEHRAAEAALDEMVATAQAAGDYGVPRCQPQDTAFVAIQALIDNYSTAGANLLDWLDADDLAAMPGKRASKQQWRDWGSDVACRATFRALRQAKDAVAAKPDTTTGSMTKPVMSRPAAPTDGKRLWYRGWEAAYDPVAASWGCEGWYACLGGEDLDCILVRGRTWGELLDEIDDHDKTEK